MDMNELNHYETTRQSKFIYSIDMAIIGDTIMVSQRVPKVDDHDALELA